MLYPRIEFPVQFACKNAILYIGSPENIFIVAVKQEGFLYSLCTQNGENMRITINRSFNRQTLIKVLVCPRDLSQETLSLSRIAVFSTCQSRRYHCAYSRLLKSRRTSVESALSMA
jgi:hypothetical protein